MHTTPVSRTLAVVPSRNVFNDITNALHLAQDFLGVGLELGAQLHPRQVGLQQQVGLHVGVIELGVVEFVGYFLCQLKHKIKMLQNDQFLWFAKTVNYNLALSEFLFTCRRSVSSWCLMGMFLYSAALEMISINPRIFVFAFKDMLNNSAEHTILSIQHNKESMTGMKVGIILVTRAADITWLIENLLQTVLVILFVLSQTKWQTNACFSLYICKDSEVFCYAWKSIKIHWGFDCWFNEKKLKGISLENEWWLRILAVESTAREKERSDTGHQPMVV